MSESKDFIKVNQLRPLASGLTLTVKVVSIKKGIQKQIAECLVGDETGMIVFTARNNQADKMKEGDTLILNNAKIEIYKGSMRLAIDRRGTIEPAEEPASFKVMEDNNLSLIEFEQVMLVEE